MSGERQWTLVRSHLAFPAGGMGPRPEHGEKVRVVEASRLTAVEAERDALRTERDAYRETLAELNAAGEEHVGGWVWQRVRAVLARFPKSNETEQGCARRN